VKGPVSLWATWLAVLAVLEVALLTASVKVTSPEWATGTLVIAAVAAIPLFLVCPLILQTRFRKELLEDEYYTQLEGAPVAEPPRGLDDAGAARFFLSRLPTAGVIVLYACALAHEKAKAFDYKDLAPKMAIFEPTYFQGVMFAARAALMLDVTVNGTIVNVTKTNPALLSEARAAYKGREEKTDDKFKDIYASLRTELEEYFE